MSVAEPSARDGRDRRGGPTAGSGTVGLTILGSVGLAVLVAGLAIASRGSSESLVLLVLAGLAVVGVFSLFGVAVGLIRFGDKVQEADLLRLYAEVQDDGLEIIAADGTILFTNAAFRALVCSAGGAPFSGLEQLTGGDAKAGESYFRLARAAKAAEAHEEMIWLAKAGRWLKISVRPLKGASAGGHGPLTVWRVTDITGEQSRNDRTIRDLKESLNYLDSLPIGFLSSNTDGKVEHMNATLANWLGLDRARLATGEVRLAEFVSGAGSALLAAPKAGDEESAEPLKIDIDLKRVDGSSLPARLIHRPAAGSGLEARARTLVLNRSPGEALDENARLAEVRFARFFHSAPFGIATMDRSGKILSANGMFVRIFSEKKRPSPTSLKRILEHVANEEARAQIEEAREQALSGKVNLAPIEIAFGTAREETNCRLYLGPIGNAVREDDAEALILYVIDTTEQKALELKFAQSQKMEAVGKLAGGIAHDFNNVLTAIIGFSELLLQNHRPTDPAFKDIINIKSNADRAAGLVRQLLAFSRRQTLQPEVLSLSEVISDFSFMLSRYITEKVTLKLVHGRDLWLVKADRTQLEQVLMNLAVNARDAMPSGGTLTVRTRNIAERDAAKLASIGVEPGQYVLCEVEDTGTGMTPEVMAKIFEPFFSTKEVGKGTGLGLSTVYGIVKQTGGYIFPESTPGKGTAFRVYLPRHIPAPKEIEATQAKKERERDKERPRDLTGTGRVLLVEDEDAVRNFAKRALERQGYEVLEASNGAEALEIMTKSGAKVDVVVSDVVMPEMDGPTLLKELRKRKPDLKIIFVSGYPDDAFKKSLDEGETFDFLAKPFTLPQLAAKVKETMGR